MTGFVFAVAPCWACGRSFSFNPHAVPSLRWKGKRQPVCRDCMERVNRIRREFGRPEHVIRPDAYEPIEEGQL